MRTIDATHRTLLRTNFKLYFRADVRDSDLTWQPLDNLAGINWLRDFSWREDLDNAIQSGTLTLHRSVGGVSLAPLMTLSSVNQNAASSYSPLIHPGRWFRAYTAVIPHAQAAPLAGDWRMVFLGKIARVSWEDSPISVQVYDIGIRLAQRYIVDKVVYGGVGVDMEVVIQDLIDNNGALATLVTPVSPSFVINQYKQDTGFLLDALRRIAIQAGFEVRHKWAATGDAFDLTLYDPRAGAGFPALTTFGPDEYFNVTNLDIDDEDVRNLIQGAYVDSVSGFQVRQVENTVSQAEFDAVRFMRLTESAANHINTSVEMDAMLNAALNDLSGALANQSIETFYFWPVQLGDLYTFQANGVHYDEDHDWAVTGYSHNVTAAGKGRTVMGVRGTPAGAYKRWINLGAGLPTSVTPTMPIVTFGPLIGEGTADGDQPYGMVRLPITWGENCHRVYVKATYGTTSGQPSPPADTQNESIVIDRPEGDICQAVDYFMYHEIRAETGEWVAVEAWAENTDTGQQTLRHFDEVQATDVGVGPTAAPGAITTTVTGADINVSVPKGDLNATLLIYRNHVNIAVIPGDGVTTTFDIDDTNLTTGKVYNYVAAELRNGQSSAQSNTGNTTSGGSDDPDAPVLQFVGQGADNGNAYAEFFWAASAVYSTSLTMELRDASLGRMNFAPWQVVATGLAPSPGVNVKIYGGYDDGFQAFVRLVTVGPNPVLVSNTIVATWGYGFSL